MGTPSVSNSIGEKSYSCFLGSRTCLNWENINTNVVVRVDQGNAQGECRDQSSDDTFIPAVSINVKLYYGAVTSLQVEWLSDIKFSSSLGCGTTTWKVRCCSLSSDLMKGGQTRTD